MMFGTADLLTGSHQSQGNTWKLYKVWGTTQALSPTAQNTESEVGFWEYMAESFERTKDGMYKASGVPDGEGSAEGSTPGCDQSGYLNTIGTGT